jgi:peroxin-3
MEAFVLRESGMSTDDGTHLQPPGATPPPPTTTPTLRRLLDETSDLIDSPPFSHVLTLLLDAAFSHLVDTKIAHQAYKIPQVSASQTRIQELVNPEDAKAKVANTLAVFCRQAHSIGSGAENEYLAAIEGVKDLEAFAAVVYSSHFEFEAVAASDSAPTGLATPATATPAVSVSRPSTADTENENRYGGRGYESSFVVEDSAFESAWGKAMAKEEGKSA